MPMFRKLDPKKFDIKSGRLHALKNKGGKGDGKGAADKGPFSLPSALPFSQIVVTVLLAQQVCQAQAGSVKGRSTGTERCERDALGVWASDAAG